MRPSAALARQRAAVREAPGCVRTAKPRVVGAALRGTDTETSDLDLLVDALPGTPLFDQGGLQQTLEAPLGVRVDRVTPGDLPAGVRAAVLAEAQPV